MSSDVQLDVQFVLASLRSELAEVLHRDVQIDIYRHAKSQPLLGAAGEGDLQRPLTLEGQWQSKNLGGAIRKHGITYDMVIISPALRARDTAYIAITTGQTKVTIPFHFGQGNEFYLPKTVAHAAEIFRLADELKHLKYSSWVAADTMGIFPQLQIEILQGLLKIPHLRSARRIFFSNHAVIGSCLAEVLLQTITGGVDETSRQVLDETAVPECGCLEVSRQGVTFKTYI